MCAKRRKPLFAGTVVLALVIILLSVEYHPYAYAVAWHCVHGNYAEIGGHRVRLPVLWWKEKADAYDTSLLVRACPARTFIKPEITISPTPPGSVRDTDRQELDSIQALVSSANHNALTGTSSSLVILNPKPFTLYCKKRRFCAFWSQPF